MASNELLEAAELDILQEVTTAQSSGAGAPAARIIKSVSAKLPPVLVREAYWQLISENRMTRSAQGLLSVADTSR